MKDQLFVLRPGFDDKGKTYFCPYSAQVMGFLAYYPQVKDSVELIELEFAKPRKPLSDILDDKHQSAPMLVLAGDGIAVPDVELAESNGRKYVEKTIQILRYLAATRSVPMPH